MPIRRLPDGQVVFDTVEEAVAYEQALAHARGGENRGSSRSAWARLMGELAGESHGHQRQILREVKAAGAAGIQRESLALALKVTHQGIGGAMGGLSKACRRAGLELADVIRADGYNYMPGPLLAEGDVSE